MLLQQLFDHLGLRVDPIAVCVVSAGWRLKVPDPPGTTLHFVLEGEGELRTPGRPPALLRPHTLVLVPHRRHSIKPDGATAHERTVRVTGRPTGRALPHVVAGVEEPGALVVACGHLEASWAGGIGLFDLLDQPIVADFADSPEMARTVDRMLAESRKPSPGQRAMTAALMSECLLLLFRRLCGGPECKLPWLAALEDPHLAPALAAVLQRPADPHTVASLAQTAGLSRSAFAESFAAAFAQTPMTFVREVRLRRAAELLQTSGLPVDAVAHRVGLASRSHFSRLFTARFGCPPGRYRSVDA